MKRFLFVAILLAIVSNTSAQDSTAQRPMVYYTFFVNNVPDGFKFPLIGFMNQAMGDHVSLEAGFLNTTRKNLMGLQSGFINTVGKNVTGMQAGFINTCGDSLSGMQAGFINTVKSNVLGTQMGFTNVAGGYVFGIQSGFLNTVGDSVVGIQSGFINTGAKKVSGVQLGFVNTTKNLKGIQSGFANTSSLTEGAQIGFINTGGTVKGLQLGFINVADTVEGVSFGFLSFVKKGGYSSVEAGVSEMYAANIAYRIGIRKFYTVLMASYNPNGHDPFALGGGFGAIFPLGKRFYLNPEALSQNTMGDFAQQNVSFTPYIGFTISKRFHIAAGPSVVWNNIYSGSNEFHEPLFSIYSNTLDARNRIITGARIGIRYNFKW